MAFSKKLTDLVGYIGAPIVYFVIWLCTVPQPALSRHIALVLYELHFLKRCLEVQYVHNSNKRAPVETIEALLEWVYYIVFAAVSSMLRHNPVYRLELTGDL